MSNKKIKFFYSVTEEEKWLNKVGADGYKLTNISWNVYTFEKTDDVWYYSMEWLDSSPDTEENKQYISSRTDCECCAKSNCYVYFASNVSQPERSADAVKKISKRYISVALFWTVVFALLAALAVYNYIWLGKFNDLGYKVYYSKDEIWAIFKDLVVGKNPAQLLLYIVLPLTGISAAFTLITWWAYFAWKNFAKKNGFLTKKDEKSSGEENEEFEL